MPQDPGGPPQRPQVGGESLDVEDFEVSLATAKTLSFRVVCFEPHSGQGGFGPSAMERCRCSKDLSHDLQVYS